MYRFHLACLFDRVGRFDDALPQLQQANALSPGDLDYIQELTWCLWNLKRYDQALAHAETLVDKKPETAIYWSLRGRALDAKWRFFAAESSFRRACTLEPQTERYRVLLATQRKRCLIFVLACIGFATSGLLLVIHVARRWLSKTALHTPRA